MSLFSQIGPDDLLVVKDLLRGAFGELSPKVEDHHLMTEIRYGSHVMAHNDKGFPLSVQGLDIVDQSGFDVGMYTGEGFIHEDRPRIRDQGPGEFQQFLPSAGSLTNGLEVGGSDQYSKGSRKPKMEELK